MLASNNPHDLIDWLTHMNWVDFVFLVVIVYSTLTGAWLGFMAECVTLAGIAAGVLFAGIAYSGAGSLLGHAGVPNDARDWVGFVVVFLVVSLIFRVCSLLARKLSQVMVRGKVNGIAGALLGLLAGCLLCLFALVTVAYFKVGPFVDPLQHSKIAATSAAHDWLGEFASLLPAQMHTLPGFLP